MCGLSTQIQRLSGKLDQLLQKQDLILRRLSIMADETVNIDQATTDLAASVAAETTVEASAIALIEGLAAQIGAANASGDAAKVEALVQQIGSSSAALAAAIAANTIASPAAAAVATANLTPQAAALVQAVVAHASPQAPAPEASALATSTATA